VSDEALETARARAEELSQNPDALRGVLTPPAPPIDDAARQLEAIIGN
jgi:hypothetical protein